ncbi:transglutaminase-like cysteine peptidase [Sphingomicrobium flavum]|uniref:transglutaminase-like cysteine peptidase n=1 Tax=Sphingomicrobium flavum TaxID=1229164 RepID=UPI0021AD7AE9|nr:transglutaminase-like cysteine peptidase [Sphingomicrobium flavum]
MMKTRTVLTAGLALFTAPFAATSASATDSLDPHAAAPQLAAYHAPVTSAKSNAILGGQTSSLAAIMSNQNGATTASVTFGAPIAPAASYTAASLPAHRVVKAAHASRPDIFGTIALEVDRTPFDTRWNTVARAPVHGAAADFARMVASTSEREAIEAINRYVNDRVSFVEDLDRFGVRDRWVRASDTLAAGRGDCEDYAIAKMAMLKAAGFRADDLYLVVAKDLIRRADHAVLVVRSEGKFLVLDNNTDRIEDANAIADFRPILTYASTGRWTHGYERQPVAPPIFTADAARPQRKYSEVPVAITASLPIPSFAL